MKTNKNKIETSCEQYFRIKIERSRKRREFAKELFIILGAMCGIALAGALTAVITVSLCGGWKAQKFDQKRFDQLNAQVQELKQESEINRLVRDARTVTLDRVWTNSNPMIWFTNYTN